MRGLKRAIRRLRSEMEQAFAQNERGRALRVSRRLDRQIMRCMRLRQGRFGRLRGGRGQRALR